MKRIYRASYMEHLVRLIGTPDIKIITGMRRSGKSELLRAFKTKLHTMMPDVNIIHIDYADLAFDELKDLSLIHI